MVRSSWTSSLALAAFICSLNFACESGGVGAPCIPEEEYEIDFPGFAKGEVNVESRSFQCESRVCLVKHFQGRVSCPYGQIGNAPEVEGINPASPQECLIPGGVSGRREDTVNVAVKPQITTRRPDQAVYCSCRCGGKDPNARYCECPSGFKCTELVPSLGAALGAGSAQLEGNYCVKNSDDIDNPDTIASSTAFLCAAGTDINNPETDCGPWTGPE